LGEGRKGKGGNFGNWGSKKFWEGPYLKGVNWLKERKGIFKFYLPNFLLKGLINGC